MKYVSLDIETTGLDSEVCQILEIGMVLEDTTVLDIAVKDLPTFHCYVLHDDPIRGEPYALSMHSEILKRIASPAKFQEYHFEDHETVFYAICDWLKEHASWTFKDRLNIAGKNVAGFDMQFLKQLPNQFWNGVFRHCVIDPVHYWLEAGDECMPDTRTCYKRAGMDEVVAHTAVEDAQSVIELLRRANFGT